MSSANVYDFVIIGGGTAGLVVANRLTEVGNVTVLVLEAGGDASADPRVVIPAMWSAVLGTDLDWDFMTTPQAGLKERRVGHPQGRLLGGSSAINAEVFVPPSSVGIDVWEQMGNQGWGWAGLSPYFRKFHTLHAPSLELEKHLSIDWIGGEESRGTQGPVQASFAGVVEDPLGKAWVDTFAALNHRASQNPFSGAGTGGWSSPSSIDPSSKTRSYSASAYLAPIRSRPNLEVVTNALVDRIVIGERVDGEGLHATGVSYRLPDGSEKKVEARKEVILAAGAFQSPKILELSGIGDPEILKTHGIEVKVANSNVGENLQDHLMTGVSFETADGVMTGDVLLRQEPQFVQMFMQMYQENKTGPFASGSVMSYAFMPVLSELLSKVDPNQQARLNEIVRASAAEATTEFEQEQLAFVQKLLATRSEASSSLFMLPAQVNLHNGPKQAGMLANPQPGNYVSLGAALLHPLSRGRSHLASADPTVAPIIDPRYLSHPLDVEVFARHLMAVEVLAATAPLSEFLKPQGRRAQPGATKLDTVDKAKEYVRETALTNNHPVGTCAMLPREKGGVVDSRLKVFGVHGLRVVDASIMPIISRCNTQTVVYAVAEKAADLIKEDWKLS